MQKYASGTKTQTGVLEMWGMLFWFIVETAIIYWLHREGNETQS